MPNITIPIPDVVQASYLVPLTAAPDNLIQEVADAARRLLDPPILDLVLQTIGTPVLKVHIINAQLHKLPPELFTALSGASNAQLEMLRNTPFIASIHGSAQPGWPAVHEFAARAAAAVLAAEQANGIVLDVFTPSVLDALQALQSLPDHMGQIRLADWLCVLLSGDAGQYWLTTSGLARFGFPELQIFDLPAQLRDGWVPMMTGIAMAFLGRVFPELASGESFSQIEMPDNIVVSDYDINDAYRTNVTEGGGNAIVRLELTESEFSKDVNLLTISPPAGEMRSAGEYFFAAYNSIFRGPERQVVKAQASEDMDNAIQTARSSLPEVRQRFLENQLPSDAQVIVKHQLVNGADCEFIWAFVHDWHDAERIQCTCAGDAKLDPRFRAGRAVQVLSNDVVDWAIWLEGNIVEGAFTDRVLMRDRR
jgi:hypothetical protein